MKRFTVWLIFLTVLVGALPATGRADSLLKYIRGEDLGQEEMRLRESLGLEPMQYYDLALVLAKGRRPGEMKEILAEGLATFPTSFKLKYKAAALYKELRYRQEALTLYGELVELDEANASDYYEDMSTLYWELGEAEQALETNFKALKTAPTLQLYRRLAQDYFANAHLFTLSAEDFYLRCLAALPNEVPVYQDWADYLGKQGRYEEMEKVYYRIQTLQPFHHSYSRWLQFLTDNKQDPVEALSSGNRPLDFLMLGLYWYDLSKESRPEEERTLYLARAEDSFSRWLAALSPQERQVAIFDFADFLGRRFDWHWAQKIYLQEFISRRDKGGQGEAILGLARAFKGGGVPAGLAAGAQTDQKPLLNFINGLISVSFDKTMWNKMNSDMDKMQQNYMGLIYALEIYDYYLFHFANQEDYGSVVLAQMEILAGLEWYDELLALADDALLRVEDATAATVWQLKARAFSARREHLTAAECYSRALALEKNKAEREDIFALLIQQYSLVNKFSLARKAYREEALLRKDDIRFWYDYARFERVRFDNDLVIYEEMLQYFPEDTSLLWTLANRYKTAHRWEDVLRVLYQGAFVDKELASEYWSTIMMLGRLEKQAAEFKGRRDIVALKLYGDMMLHLSYPAEALPFYEEILRLAPHRTDILERLGHLYRSLQLWDDAADAFAAWSYYEPTNPQVLILLGEVYWESGRQKEAHDAWQGLVGLDCLNPSLYLELATVLYDYYANREAMEAILAGRKILKDPTFAAFEMGVLREEEGELGAALVEYLAAIDKKDYDYRETEEIKEHFLKLARRGLLNDIKTAFRHAFMDEKTGLQLYFFAADLFFDLGEPGSGEEVLAKAGRKDWSKQGYLELARRWRNLGKFVEEEKVLKDALARRGEELDLLRTLWRNYKERNMPVEAVEVLTTLYKKEPGLYLDPYLEALVKLKKYDRVQFVLTEALGRDPSDINLYLKKAAIYSRAGETEEAARVYDQTLKTALDTEEKDLIVQVYLARAEFWADLGDFVSAREECMKAINLNPLDVNLLRRVYLQLETWGELAAFFSFYEKTAREAERDYRWNMVLYRANRYRGDFGKRLAALRRACAIEPHRVDLKEYLAWEYWRGGHLAAAAKEYGDLLLYYEDSSYRRTLLKYVLKVNLQLGEREKALIILDEFIAEAGDNVYSLTNLAEEVTGYGLYDIADKILDKAARIIGTANLANSYYYNKARVVLELTRGRPRNLLPVVKDIYTSDLVSFGVSRYVYDDIKKIVVDDAVKSSNVYQYTQKAIELLAAKGDWRGTVDLYTRLIEGNPDEWRWYANLARVYKDRDLWPELERLAEQAIYLFPWEGEGYLWQAESLLAQGQKEKALQVCTMVPEIPVVSMDKYFAVNSLLKKYGNFEEGLVYLELAAGLFGNTGVIELERILNLLAAGYRQEGEQLLVDILTDTGKDPYSLLSISYTLEANGEYDLSLLALNNALLLAEKEGLSSFAMNYRTDEQRKLLYGKLGLLAELADYYENILEQGTDQLFVSISLAETLLQLERWERAVEVCRLALDDYPGHNVLFNLLLQGLEEGGQEGAVLALLRDRLRDDYTNLHTYLEYADKLFLYGQVEEAVFTIKTMFANFPHFGDVLVEGGKRLLAWNRAAELDTYLTVQLALEPDNKDLQILFIEYALATGQYEEGLRMQAQMMPAVYDPYNEAYLTKLRCDLLIDGGMATARLAELGRLNIKNKSPLLLLEESLLLVNEGRREEAWILLEKGTKEYRVDTVLYPAAVKIAGLLGYEEEKTAFLAELKKMEPHREDWHKTEMDWFPFKEPVFSGSVWSFDWVGGDY